MAPKLSYQISSQALFLLLVIQAIIVESESQFSKSLRLFHGAQKGHTVKGLNQVKQYLNAFGYYSTNGINLSDEFDESLEDALKAYQRHYRLRAVGRIDSDTIKKMSVPRCGVRDVFNNSKDGVRSGTVADYSFFNGMPRWNKRQLSYRFRSSAQVFSVRRLRPIMAEAFRKWGDVSNFTFQEGSMWRRSDIELGFHRRFHGDNAPFDGPGNIIAHAFAPQLGWLHFDADENWSIDDVARFKQFDLQTVAIHEIGHVLGLAHSQDPNSVMYAYYRFNRNLRQDDIDGIRALYSS